MQRKSVRLILVLTLIMCFLTTAAIASSPTKTVSDQWIRIVSYSGVPFTVNIKSNHHVWHTTRTVGSSIEFNISKQEIYGGIPNGKNYPFKQGFASTYTDLYRNGSYSTRYNYSIVSNPTLIVHPDEVYALFRFSNQVLLYSNNTNSLRSSIFYTAGGGVIYRLDYGNYMSF